MVSYQNKLSQQYCMKTHCRNRPLLVAPRNWGNEWGSWLSENLASWIHCLSPHLLLHTDHMSSLSSTIQSQPGHDTYNCNDIKDYYIRLQEPLKKHHTFRQLTLIVFPSKYKLWSPRVGAWITMPSSDLSISNFPFSKAMRTEYVKKQQIFGTWILLLFFHCHSTWWIVQWQGR